MRINSSVLLPDEPLSPVVCRENVLPSTMYISFIKTTIFIAVDPYIATGYEPGLDTLPTRNRSIYTRRFATRPPTPPLRTRF